MRRRPRRVAPAGTSIPAGDVGAGIRICWSCDAQEGAGPAPVPACWPRKFQRRRHRLDAAARRRPRLSREGPAGPVGVPLWSPDQSDRFSVAMSSLIDPPISISWARVAGEYLLAAVQRPHPVSESDHPSDRVLERLRRRPRPARRELDLGNLLAVLRALQLAQQQGPDLADVRRRGGRDEVQERLEATVERVEGRRDLAAVGEPEVARRGCASPPCWCSACTPRRTRRCSRRSDRRRASCSRPSGRSHGAASRRRRR